MLNTQALKSKESNPTSTLSNFFLASLSFTCKIILQGSNKMYLKESQVAESSVYKNATNYITTTTVSSPS